MDAPGELRTQSRSQRPRSFWLASGIATFPAHDKRDPWGRGWEPRIKLTCSEPVSYSENITLIWLAFLLNSYITASRVGLQVKYKNARHAIYVVRHSEDLLAKRQREKGLLKSISQQRFCWLWGKSPDLRQKVSVVKKHVFLESTSRVEATSQSWTREGHFVEAKLCKVTSIPDVQLDGAYSHYVSPLFKSEKVNGQRFKTVLWLTRQIFLTRALRFGAPHSSLPSPRE